MLVLINAVHIIGNIDKIENVLDKSKNIKYLKLNIATSNDDTGFVIINAVIKDKSLIKLMLDKNYKKLIKKYLLWFSGYLTSNKETNELLFVINKLDNVAKEESLFGF